VGDVNEFEYMKQKGWFNEVVSLRMPEIAEYAVNLDDF
jgi:hypothetical protein